MTTTSNETGREDHVSGRLETSRGLLEWLGGELADRARLGHASGKASDVGQSGVAAGGRAVRRVDRLAMQLARVCELVNLALTQVDFHNDLGMAWILLEQARQQLGHAALSAGTSDPERRSGEGGVEAGAMAQLVWFLQRDRMPWPDDASIVVDFGGGAGQLPDFRPDTPLELLPLQLLAHSVMTFGAGEAVQDLDNRVVAMAFGEYGWTILAEAMELLESCADHADETNLGALVDTGFQVADLIAGAFPPAWQLFQGPAGFPDHTD